MEFENLERILFDGKDSIRKVLESFNQTAQLTEARGFGLVLNKGQVLLGVVSDGDIRRELVKGVSLDDPVSVVMKRDFVYATEKHTPHQILRLFDSRVVNLPLLDEKLRLKGLYQYSRFKVSAYAQPRIIRARVPVRISFSGGGTDFSHYIKRESSFVLSSTINKFCTASVLPRDDKQIHIISKDLDQECESMNLDELVYDGKLDLLKAAIRVMQPDFGFNLETFSEFEIGTGLGGSSAMVVAVIGALNNFRNENQLDSYQIADLAYQSERIELGIEGGWQDQYTTVFGGFNWVEFRKNEVVVNPLRLIRETLLELEYNLMLFRIGGNHNSGIIQKEFIENIKRSNKVTRLLEAMADISVQMKECLLKGRIKQFGDLLHKSWDNKKAMNQGVSNPLIDRCYQTALDLGALGGKLLGAGQGGYMLIYASPRHQRKIQEALFELSCSMEPLRFTESGLEVWSAIR
jgi:D-glycero-alpha-D-manno-heptose-7-phosphate kinase